MIDGHNIWPLFRAVCLVVFVAVPAYVVACRIWSYSACRRCEGQPHFRTSSGKAWRKCPRCKGTGERIRLGRKIWDHIFRKAHR